MWQGHEAANASPATRGGSPSRCRASARSPAPTPSLLSPRPPALRLIAPLQVVRLGFTRDFVTDSLKNRQQNKVGGARGWKTVGRQADPAWQCGQLFTRTTKRSLLPYLGSASRLQALVAYCLMATNRPDPRLRSQ